MAGFDSNWGKYLPSSLYRHAERHRPFHASNRPIGHKGRAQAAINSIADGARPATARVHSSSVGRRLGGAERLLTAATSAQEAAQMVRLRFDSGVTDFLIVLDAEREVLNNRDQMAQAQAQTDTATALVSVYRALDGGWAAQ
ncbi:MAG: TolC family protein [Polaromonas sp.]|nr:TolC family protein [Polaromonas sp.]